MLYFRNVVLVTSLLFVFGSVQAQKVYDIDSNEYTIVSIGKQQWLGQNLRVTKYNDSSSIPHILTNEDWKHTNYGSYCIYPNDLNGISFLYNWEAVNSQKLCPEGWHVPTIDEWIQCIEFIGGRYDAGSKLKAQDSLYWECSNDDASNDFGFSALPGGERTPSGNFNSMGYYGYWWSATAEDTLAALRIGIGCGTPSIRIYYENIQHGYSVRCIKNE